jgi:KaiC/GvpD/RAD55 family RecA-like ATPase
MADIAALEEKALTPVEPDSFRIDDLPSVWSFDTSTNWLVEDLIPEGCVTLITGESGVGKSTLVLALVGAIAYGQKFLGKTVKKQRVLYVDRENPLFAVRERLNLLRIAETRDLLYWGLWIDNEPAGPTSPSMIAFAKTRPVMVFDSLVAFHPGSEQNASETRKHMHSYRRLAACGATVIVVHHAGKSEGSKQYRGSSDIKAAVDLAYVVDSLSDPSAGISILRVSGFKNRIALPQTLRVEFSGGLFQKSGGRQTDREIVEQIIRERSDQSQASLVKLASVGGVAKNRCLQVLEVGEREGWLIVERGRSNQKNYRLANG